MTDSTVAGLCRLTVRAPAASVDLAVPADVPVADLMPTLLRYAGEELEESGLDHGGWILQRLGGAPLDEEGTLASLGLGDGEVLYLRPHTEALPEVRLDDLVDGIAGVTKERLHGWSPQSTHRLLLGMTVTAVATGLLVLAWPGGSPSIRALAAGLTGLLLLAGAASASRAVGDAQAGAALGLMAAPALAVAGWLLTGGDIGGPDTPEAFGARLLAAGAAGAGGAVLALAFAAVRAPHFLASALVSVAAALVGTLMRFAGLPVDGAAAAVAALLVLCGGFVPSLAFKLAGMRMPSLPSDAQQLQENIEPYEGSEVTDRTLLAGGWMTALYGATGVICAGGLVPLTYHPDLSETLTASVLTVLLLLHGRGMVNVWQRLTLVLPGVWGAVLLGLSWAASVTPADRPLVVLAFLACAALLAVAAWTVPGRRLVPYWGRAAEVLHSVLAVALIPLTLWTTGVFGWLRGLFG